MQLSLYSKITTLTSVHSRAGCFLSLSDILVFFLPTQKSRTLTQPVALLFQMHSQGWAGGHTPHMQQWDSRHWMSSEGTWGTRLLQACAELWDLAVVCVSYKVRNDSVICQTWCFHQLPLIFLMLRVECLSPKGVFFTTGLEFWQPLYSQKRNRHFQDACGNLVKIPDFLCNFVFYYLGHLHCRHVKGGGKKGN